MLLIPLAWQTLDSDPWPRLRLAWFDTIQASLPRKIDPNDLPVRIVAINDPSLESFGQWPWPRTILARLLDRISEAGGLVVGLDMLFDQPDRLSPERFAATRPDLDPETARRLMALPTNDAMLAESISKIPVVAGLAGVPGIGGAPLTRLSEIAIEGPDPRRALPRYNAMIGGYEPLHATAAGHGLLNQVVDRDGVVRRVPLVARIGDRIVPSLSVEMLRLLNQSETVILETGPLGMRAVRLGEGPDTIRLPTESDGSLLLRHGPTSQLRYLSARDIMEKDDVALHLNGKLVLVGFTASGFVDIVTTPTARQMNGVEVHAQILETALAQALVHRPSSSRWLEGGMTTVGGVAMIVLAPLLGPALSALALMAALTLCATLSIALYAEPGWLIDAAFAMVAIIGAWTAMTLITLSREAAARRAVQRQLEAERLQAAKIEGEMSAARAIQMGILPHQFPAFPDRAEFDLYALIEPARHVGGDLYDYTLVGPHHLFFMIGDVSGKGLPAALFMALSKALTRSCAERLGDAASAAVAANLEITRENASNLFVTAIIGFLDLRDGTITWVNAGHDPPFLLSPGRPAMALDGGGGPPLCAVDDFPYGVEQHQLKPGESLMLYTDGVAEATSPEETLYGLVRLEAVLTRSSDLGAKSLIETVRRDVQAFTRDAEPYDDLTLLAIRWNGAT